MVSSSLLKLLDQPLLIKEQNMSKPILGIDVSKLDLSLSLLIDKKYYQTKIDNNQQGFKVLVKWLKKA